MMTMTTEQFMEYRNGFCGAVRQAIKPVIFAEDPAYNITPEVLKELRPRDLYALCVESIECCFGTHRRKADNCEYIRIQAGTRQQCIAVLCRVFSNPNETYVELVK